MKYFISLLIGLTFFSSCFLSDWDVRLVLENKTNQRIRYFNVIKNVKDFIPDTVNCNTVELSWVDPNNNKKIRSHNRWEYLLKNHPEKILRIYIINEDSISKYGTCMIFKKQIFLKRFDLTYTDLEKLNWKVVYDEKY